MQVFLKLAGYTEVRQAVELEPTIMSKVEMRMDPLLLPEDQKEALVLNVFAKPALLGGEARVLFVNTQYVIVNDTDLLLFVQQRAGRGQSLKGRTKVCNPPADPNC